MLLKLANGWEVEVSYSDKFNFVDEAGDRFHVSAAHADGRKFLTDVAVKTGDEVMELLIQFKDDKVPTENNWYDTYQDVR